MRASGLKKDSIKSIILETLSSGNHASILSVSRIIPRYCKHLVGPIVFFSDVGMLSLLNIIVNKAIVLWPAVFDGCTVKKSSNKWKIMGIS